jgi:hypothetical protein
MTLRRIFLSSSEPDGPVTFDAIEAVAGDPLASKVGRAPGSEGEPLVVAQAMLWRSVLPAPRSAACDDVAVHQREAPLRRGGV